MSQVHIPDAKPLYALAGIGDLTVERLRQRAADLQIQVKDLPAYALAHRDELRTQFQSQIAEFRRQVEHLPEDARRQVDELTKVVRDQVGPPSHELLRSLEELPAELRRQIDEMGEAFRHQADEFSAKAAAVYDDLVNRGERMVAELRGDVATFEDEDAAAQPVEEPAEEPAMDEAATEEPVGTLDASGAPEAIVILPDAEPSSDPIASEESPNA
jgi:hypothetical protein